MLYSGVTGKITIKKNGVVTEVMHASGFSVDISKKVEEISSFGSDWSEALPGIKSWKASLDGAADFGVGNGQKEILTAFDEADELECAFYLNDDTFLTGTAVCDSLSINHAVEGKADVSASLIGSGAVAMTGPEDAATHTLGELDVTSAAGAAQNGSVITVSPASPTSGNHYVYKLGTAYSAANYGDSVATWTTFASGDDIACGASTRITVCEATAANLAVGRGIAVLAKHA